MGVWCKQFNTQDNGDLRFIHKYAGKHVAQVTGTTDLAHISNANRQQFAGNNSSALSDLATQTVSKSLRMTITALSIALSSPAFYLKNETPTSFQSINNTLRSKRYLFILTAIGRDRSFRRNLDLDP
ncbi:hypothetical protein AVEN_24169-1 [Araneus ventricosus]|uniref:Uncharacterized protein n=1 Tax=Araneus ventricosus TaxID=182803 RepID=A0A4Y2HTE5_ARAVE|nr:hypothetical protein AVEN_24169-1 [Araneus ventricosus]